MKKQTHLLENILRKIIKLYFIILFLLIFLTASIQAKEKWIIDKKISKITFEAPVLFATNVMGEFKNINGFIEIDLENKENNKALLSVEIESIETNYDKYKNLLLGPLFFDSVNFPLGLLDTKKFSYKNENELKLNIELTIKGVSKIIETDIKIIKLTNDIVQILGNLKFSRTDFNIGVGSWRNTSILKDSINVDSNIFLIKE